jgi:hypothetical protein
MLDASALTLLIMLRFNEFGENGGPAVTELIPKLAIFKKHLSSLLGVGILDIDVRTFTLTCCSGTYSDFCGCYFTLYAVRFLI